MVAKCILWIYITAKAKNYRVTYFTYICRKMLNLHVDYRSSVMVNTYAMWQSYLLTGICQ